MKKFEEYEARLTSVKKVSLSSHSIPEPRRIPQQIRGQRRVAALLDAAASVIADAGYEAATMSEIAERAGASIGSLYQFFPNKECVAQAVRMQYADQLEDAIALIVAETKIIGFQALVDRMLTTVVEFIESHPAMLVLMEVSSSDNCREIKQRFRRHLAEFFLAQKKHLSKAEAARLAAVTLEIFKSLNTLYAESKPGERRHLVQEFKTVLVCYLSSRLKGAQ